VFGEPLHSITPKEYEDEVRCFIEAMGVELTDFEVHQLESLSGVDGDYEIDVTARFSALGASFLVLVECKRYRNRVKREVLEKLFSRMKSVGAQKGMVFSTSNFQSGAIEFAKVHGIATVVMVEGTANYQTRSLGDQAMPSPGFDFPKFVGWLVRLNEKGNERFSRVDRTDARYLRECLFGKEI